MMSRALEEYVIDSAEYYYEESGQHVPMGFMDTGGEFHDAKNDSRWEYQKHPSFTRSTYSENNNWEAAVVCMSVSKEAKRNATGRFNVLLYFLG